jgi:hypothetical protein
MAQPTFHLVELFSGSSSVAKAARAEAARAAAPGYRMSVHSVDIHPKYNPTTATDILKWDYKPALREFLGGVKPGDVVWVHASPPCTEFSRAKTTAPRDLPLADGLVQRTLRIIKFCKQLSQQRLGREAPFFWTIENPVGLLRTRPYMQRLRPYLNTTSYCKWGKPFRKDTDIWTNVPGLELPVCRQGTYCATKAALGHHPVTAQSGHSGSGSQRFAEGSGAGENVYPLPSRLTRSIVRAALQQTGPEPA